MGSLYKFSVLLDRPLHWYVDLHCVDTTFVYFANKEDADQEVFPGCVCRVIHEQHNSLSQNVCLQFLCPPTDTYVRTRDICVHDVKALQPYSMVPYGTFAHIIQIATFYHITPCTSHLCVLFRPWPHALPPTLNSLTVVTFTWGGLMLPRCSTTLFLSVNTITRVASSLLSAMK